MYLINNNYGPRGTGGCGGCCSIIVGFVVVIMFMAMCGLLR